MTWLTTGKGLIQKLDLGQEFFTFVALVKAALSEAHRFTGWEDVLDRIKRYLDDELDGDETRFFDDLLAELDIDKTRIQQLWQRFDDKYGFLIDTVAELEQERSWPIFNRSGHANPDAGDLSFDLSGDVALNAELQSYPENDPALDALALPLTDQGGKRILRVGVDGAVKVGAGVAASYQGTGINGSLQASAGASAKAELDFFYQTRANEIMVAALASGLESLPNPFRLDSIAENGRKRLRAVRFGVDGTVGVGAQVGLGYLFGTSVDASSVVDETDAVVTVGGRVGLSFGVQVAQQGMFDLVITPHGDHQVMVNLTRVSGGRREGRFDLTADIGITGLDKVGQAFVEQYLPDPGDLLTKLEGYLDIGAQLKAKFIEAAAGLLGAGDVDAQLIELLSGNQTAAGAVDTLAAALKEAVDRKIGLWEAGAGEMALELVVDALDRLGLPEPLRSSVAEWMRNRVETVLADLIASLTQTVDGLLDGLDTSAIETLLTPLERLGENVTELTAKIQAGTTKLLTPILKFLRYYADARAKVVHALEQAAKIKVSLSYQKLWRRSTSQELMLKVVLDTNQDDCNRLLKRMLVGSFEEVLQAVRQPGVQILGGLYKELQESMKETRFAFSVLGMSMEARSVLKSDFQVQADLNGNVVSAASQVELQRRVSRSHEYQELRFLNLTDLAVDQKATASATLALYYRDTKLHDSEIKQFYGSLEAAKLLRPGTMERIFKRYVGFGSPNRSFFRGRKWPDMEVSVNLVLDAAMLDRLCNATPAMFAAVAADADVAPLLRNVPDTQIRQLHTALQSLKGIRDMPFNADAGNWDATKRLLNDRNKVLLGTLKKWLHVRNVVQSWSDESVRDKTLALFKMMTLLVEPPDEPIYLAPLIKWTYKDRTEMEIVT